MKNTESGLLSKFAELIESRNFPLVSILIVLSVFGLVSHYLSYLTSKLLLLIGIKDSSLPQILLDSEMGFQILAIIASVFAYKQLVRFFVPSKSRADQVLVKLPVNRWLDAFFYSFYKLALWAGILVFSGLFVLESSFLVLRGSSQVFWISLLNWVFYAGLFWVWYSLLFRFRFLIVSCLKQLDLSLPSIFVVATVLETLLWARVAGFNLESYSGFVFDATFYLLVSGLFAAGHVYDSLQKVDLKKSLRKGTALFVFIFIFGCPLLKLNQPSFLVVFPGPLFEKWVSVDLLNSFTTFTLRELVLAAWMILGSNTLPQLLPVQKLRFVRSVLFGTKKV